jgi:hypothetical protein
VSEPADTLRAYAAAAQDFGRGLVWLLRRILLPWTVNHVLVRWNRELRTRVETLQLENELLGQLNEDLRRWLVANTAAAVQVARVHGVHDVPAQNGRQLTPRL